MATYSYKARTSNGQPTKGTIDSRTELEARRKLKANKLVVLSLREKKGLSMNIGKGVHMSLKDKIVLTEQLAVMVKSGLSVSKALTAIGNEVFNNKVQKMLQEVAAAVDGGIAFSDALQPYEKTFGSVYIQMVKAGEKGGKLDDVLARLAHQLQKDADIKGKIKSALMYPIIIVFLMIGVIAVIMVFVIPRLKDVFTNANVELPIATKILIGASNFFVNYGLWIIVVAILAVGGFYLLLNYARFALLWDTIKIRIPLYGPFAQRVYLARFSLSFASLLSSGLPILEIMNTSRDVINNRAYQRELTVATKKIENGVPIATALRESSYFPNMIAQLVSIGEKSGSLEEVMWVVSNFYEKEVDAITRNLSAALEPIIMIALGIGVAFILVSVLQPMYNLVDTI